MGCRHLGVEEDAQMEHNPISLFSLGNQAQKLRLSSVSQPLLLTPHSALFPSRVSYPPNTSSRTSAHTTFSAPKKR